MKKILIALCMLCVGFAMQAQETKVSEQQRKSELAKIDLKMKVDTSIFKKITLNMYASEKPQIIITGLVTLLNYESAKSNLEQNLPRGITISKKEEKMMNGVKVLYVEGSGETSLGSLDCIVYCMKRSEDTCTVFMGMLENGADQKYLDAIHEAANSIIK